MRSIEKRLIPLLLIGLISLITTGMWLESSKAAPAEPSQRAYLGVYLGECATCEDSESHPADCEGACVAGVEKDSPAAKAEIKEKDCIIKFQGKKVTDSEQLRKMIGELKPGDDVTIVATRLGDEKTFNVKLGEVPEIEKELKITVSGSCCESGDHHRPMKMMKFRDKCGKPQAYLGIEVQRLTEQLADYFKVKDGDGILIASVMKDSPAQKAGLLAGDVIVKIDDKELEKRPDLCRVLCDKKAGDEVTLAVIRDGKEKKIKATLSDMPEDCGSCSDCGDFGMDPCHGEGMEKIKELRMIAPDFDLDDLGECMKNIRVKVDVPVEELKAQMDELKKELDELKAELKKK